jgi:hypothetical protein
MVHDRNGSESSLTLSQIQQRNDGCLFVLGRILFDDFICSLLVLCVELEWLVWMVLWSVSMLGLSWIILPQRAYQMTRGEWRRVVYKEIVDWARRDVS